MTVEKRVQYETDHQFDPDTCRHYLNGFGTVLHCHHYATLFTQLADDAVDFQGVRQLTEAAEDTFYDCLESYYRRSRITDAAEKLEIACDYWRQVGMGLIEFTGQGDEYGATMDFSHVDAGWLRKWGSREDPVNFITSGFVAATAALAANRPRRSFAVTETKALVRGDRVSEFRATLR